MQAPPRAALLAVPAARQCWIAVRADDRKTMSGYYATAVKDVGSGLGAWRI